MNFTRWAVWFAGMRLTYVFFDSRMTEDQVYRALVDHDGYPPGIQLQHS